MHWPSRIAARGELRHQFCHIIDVAPTILEAAGMPEPSTVNGVTQEPMHGASMGYSFDDGQVPERHETQYFEMFCNRGIYHKGWSAVTKHRTPWEFGHLEVSFDDDMWELYDGSTDWTQAHNLADQLPEKLHELQRLFLIQAARFIPGRSQILYPGMGGLNESCVVDVKNRSHRVTAELVVPDGGADGVIVNQGASPAGGASTSRTAGPRTATTTPPSSAPWGAIVVGVVSWLINLAIPDRRRDGAAAR